MPPTKPTGPERDAKNKVPTVQHVGAVKAGTPPKAPPGKAGATAVATPPKPGESPLVPPDEKFWQRYSPNAEAPLSAIASCVLHGIVFGTLLLGVFAWFNSSKNDVEMEPVEIGDGLEGGGGGNVLGEGAGPQLSRKDDVVQDIKNDPKVDVPKPEEDKTVVKDNSVKLDDPDAVSIMEDIKKKKPANSGVFLKDALEGITGKGGGGKGWGGGTGDGVGKGTGSGTGDGTGKTNRRGRRVLRWSIDFGLVSGEEYVRKLNAIQAIIGVPDKTGKLMIIRNLSERPARPAYEDIKSINRIFWADDRQDSAINVAAALQLDVVPSQLVAFLPESIEKQLLETELAYGKKYGRKTEEDIKETEFALTFRAGKPVFTVTKQVGQIR